MTDQRWWIPSSVLDSAPLQAHLLPPGADGAGGSALCGERRRSWAQTTPCGVKSYCHACQALGGRRQRGVAAVSESRGAALNAARWCLRRVDHRPGEPLDDLPAELREMARGELRELLDMLLEDPGEARRVA